MAMPSLDASACRTCRRGAPAIRHGCLRVALARVRDSFSGLSAVYLAAGVRLTSGYAKGFVGVVEIRLVRRVSLRHAGNGAPNAPS
jgi:hypothetical protein